MAKRRKAVRRLIAQTLRAKGPGSARADQREFTRAEKRHELIEQLEPGAITQFARVMYFVPDVYAGGVGRWMASAHGDVPKGTVAMYVGTQRLADAFPMSTIARKVCLFAVNGIVGVVDLVNIELL